MRRESLINLICAIAVTCGVYSVVFVVADSTGAAYAFLAACVVLLVALLVDDYFRIL